MKRNTLTLLGIATLLSSPIFGRNLHSINYLSSPHEVMFPTPIKPLSSTNVDPQPQPVYNLFYISQMLANKNADINLNGYLNFLIDKKYKDIVDKEVMSEKFYGKGNSNFFKTQIKNDLDQILRRALESPIVTSDTILKIPSDLKLSNIDGKNNVLDIESKLKKIHDKNVSLVKLKSLISIDSLNSKLKIVFGDERLKLDEFNEKSFTKFDSLFFENKMTIAQLSQLKSVIEILNIEHKNPEIDSLPVKDTIKGFNIRYLEQNVNEDNKALIIKINNTYLKSENKSKPLHIVSNQDLINKFSNNDFFVFPNIQSDIYKNLENTYNLSTLLSVKEFKIDDSLTSNFSKLKEKYTEVRNERNQNFNELVEKIAEQKKSLNPVYYDSKLQENQINALRVVSYTPVIENNPQQAKTGFKLPSESDVIMGVAKFMANRAKQETMIWFVQKLQKEMQNSLMLDAFPSTYEQIRGTDPLNSLNFNGPIQMALSEDFVKLPYNIIGGNWLANKVTSDQTELEILKNTMQYSSHLFQLMNGKKSYRSILENLQVQKPYFLKNLKHSKSTDLSNAIDLLYFVINELYSVQGTRDNVSLRLLNAADLEYLSLEQWEIFLNLIELKYDASTKDYIQNYFEAQFKDIKAQEVTEIKIQKEQIIKNRLSAILNAMQRLDETTKNDDFASTEQKAIKVLDQISTLFKYSDPHYNELTGDYNKTALKQINQFDELLNIYKQINKKDFGAVVKSTLKLVEPVIQKDKFELLIQDNNLIVKNNELDKLMNLVRKNKKDQLFQLPLPEKLNLTNNISFKLEDSNLMVYEVSQNTIDIDKLKKRISAFKNLKSTNDPKLPEDSAISLKEILEKIKHKEEELKISNFKINLNHFISSEKLILDKLGSEKIKRNKNLKSLVDLYKIAEDKLIEINNDVSNVDFKKKEIDILNDYITINREDLSKIDVLKNANRLINLYEKIPNSLKELNKSGQYNKNIVFKKLNELANDKNKITSPNFEELEKKEEFKEIKTLFLLRNESEKKLQELQKDLPVKQVELEEIATVIQINRQKFIDEILKENLRILIHLKDLKNEFDTLKLNLLKKEFSYLNSFKTFEEIHDYINELESQDTKGLAQKNKTLKYSLNINEVRNDFDKLKSLNDIKSIESISNLKSMLGDTYKYSELFNFLFNEKSEFNNLAEKTDEFNPKTNSTSNKSIQNFKISSLSDEEKESLNLLSEDIRKLDHLNKKDVEINEKITELINTINEDKTILNEIKNLRNELSSYTIQKKEIINNRILNNPILNISEKYDTISVQFKSLNNIFDKIKSLNDFVKNKAVKNNLTDILPLNTELNEKLLNIIKDEEISFSDQSFSQFLNNKNSVGNLLTQMRYVNLIVDLLDNPKQISANHIYDHLNLRELNKNLHMFNESGQLLVKTATFFTEIMSARDEDGVYRAIESVVAPPTSYLTKRSNSHSLTFNGYVGAYAGYQHVRSTLSDYKSSFTYGITAPIGFTYSTPKWGIFIQAIDLGNLVGHYIWETNKEYEKQKVSVKEVFSPGMNFLYNIPDSPFVLFTGMKMVQIPERLDEERGYINSGALDIMQFTAGIKIDIPFFTIKKW